jgi:hypothetical protein
MAGLFAKMRDTVKIDQMELTAMKHDMVQTTAFDMPLMNPAFPPGPTAQLTASTLPSSTGRILTRCAGQYQNRSS